MAKSKAELIELFGSEAEDGGKWMLQCLKHWHIMQFTSKKVALGHKAHPEWWCEPCMDDSTYCYTCEMQFPDYYLNADGTADRHEGHEIGKGQ
jgi:hypothetical protein